MVTGRLKVSSLSNTDLGIHGPLSKNSEILLRAIYDQMCEQTELLDVMDSRLISVEEAINKQAHHEPV